MPPARPYISILRYRNQTILFLGLGIVLGWTTDAVTTPGGWVTFTVLFTPLTTEKENHTIHTMKTHRYSTIKATFQNKRIKAQSFSSIFKISFHLFK